MRAPARISMVIAALDEAASLPELLERLRAALRDFPKTEFLIVDDGSTDGTFDVLRKLARTEPRIRAFQLATNVGSQRALLLGLEKARGDVMICIDADLQQPPELLPRMISAWGEGFDVVHMVRTGRGGESLARTLATSAFYRAFNLISAVHVTPDAADFKLLDRSCVDQLIAKRPLFLRAGVHALQVKQTELTYEAATRRHGESRYTARRLIKAGLEALLPLRLQRSVPEPKIIAVIP
ncbi:MAG: glycosyltransferase family 2 protein [Archangium sp.]